VKVTKQQKGELTAFVQDREMEHLLNPVKMLVKENLPKIELGSIQIGETKEGDLVEVPRWAAEVFAELGFAEVQEDDFEVEVLKALSRERIQGPTQLSTIKSDFYIRLKRHLDQLKEASHSKRGSKHDYDEVYMKARDLLTLRTVKLLPLAVGEYTPDLAHKITPEESQLFILVRVLVQQWKHTILEGSEDE